MKKDELISRISGTIDETSFTRLGNPRRGKVRDIYESGGNMFFLTTDRISAFDRVITTLPFKGFILTSIAGFWFWKTENIVKNHIIAIPHPNVMHVKKLKPIEVEMVVRAYITGVTSTSLWTMYSQGKRVVSGHRMTEGLKKNEKLPEPIITPSTKAFKGHDRTVSPAELIKAGVVSQELYDELARVSLELFSFAAKWCAGKGVILVDTKYEFGIDENGGVTLMDEVHTPDSSRFWDAESYESSFSRGEDPLGFDKEYVRKWLKNAGYSGEGDIPAVPDEVRAEAAVKYINAYEKITGECFAAPYENAMESLAAWAYKAAI